MLVLYIAAKLLEHHDLPIASWLPTGGHPWKHLAAAAALWVFICRHNPNVVITGASSSSNRTSAGSSPTRVSVRQRTTTNAVSRRTIMLR